MNSSALNYGMVFPNVVILVAMLELKSVKAATVASATRAAATAYSESSSPPSSLKKFLLMIILLRMKKPVSSPSVQGGHCANTTPSPNFSGLLNLVSEIVDSGGNLAA